MWRMNENGLLELLPQSSNQNGNLIQIAANSQNDLPVEAFVEENEIGSISTQESGTSDEIGSNVHNSEESWARQVPAIVHYIRLEDGSEMKFSQMLFQSGKQLLTDKIINLSEGRAQEKYNTSAHLEYLNTMFPLTRRYSPPVVSRRIISYMNQCKTRVKDQGKTGQGMRDEANFNQGYSQEEELVFLLRDTNKSCDEVSAARVHYGANTRYTANSEEVRNVASLEDEVSCMICNQSGVDIVTTDAGQVCLGCYQKQVSGVCDLTGQKEARNRQEVAKMRKNEALLNMSMSGPESGGSNKVTKTKATGEKKKATGEKKSKRFELDSDEEQDESLNEMLMLHLKGSKEEQALEAEKKKLEMEKIKLEIAIKKRKLEQMNLSD